MAVVSLNGIGIPSDGLRGWSKLEALFGEWWQRAYLDMSLRV